MIGSGNGMDGDEVVGEDDDAEEGLEDVSTDRTWVMENAHRKDGESMCVEGGDIDVGG